MIPVLISKSPVGLWVTRKAVPALELSKMDYDRLLSYEEASSQDKLGQSPVLSALLQKLLPGQPQSPAGRQQRHLFGIQ